MIQKISPSYHGGGEKSFRYYSFLVTTEPFFDPLALAVDCIAVRRLGVLIQVSENMILVLTEVITLGYAVSVTVDPLPAGKHTSLGIVLCRIQVIGITVAVRKPSGIHSPVSAEVEPTLGRLSGCRIRIRIVYQRPLVLVFMAMWNRTIYRPHPGAM